MLKGWQIHGFDWDDGNRNKNDLKHAVSVASIEGLFKGEPLVVEDRRHSSDEPRYLAIGLDGSGRWMLVSFTLRMRSGQRLLRPISAR